VSASIGTAIVSYGSATRFLGNGEKHYIYFIDNLQQWKNFRNRLTIDEVIVKSSTTRLFLRHSVCT